MNKLTDSFHLSQGVRRDGECSLGVAKALPLCKWVIIALTSESAAGQHLYYGRVFDSPHGLLSSAEPHGL